MSTGVSTTYYRRDFGTRYSGVCERAAGAEYDGSYEKLRVTGAFLAVSAFAVSVFFVVSGTFFTVPVAGAGS